MKLYPHQEAALKDTSGQNRVAYYLDMGLGKTFLGAEKAVRMGSRVNLIVCQKSKVEDWLNHFKEHYATHDLDYCCKDLILDLTDKKQMQTFLNQAEEATTPDFIKDEWTGQTYQQENLYPFYIVGVINYDLIWRRKELLQLKDFTLILDESSLIQNQKSNRCKFILKMDPENVILLSGTPTGGKYENLWSQLHLLGWNITEKVYNAHYVNWKNINVGGVIHKVVDKDDPYKNVERLKQKMRDHGAVFMKTEEVFDLPAQNFVTVNVPVTKEYKKFTRDHLVTVDGIEFVGDSTLSFRLYQRQLCSAYNPHKIQAFRDILESTQDRLIVFYNFNCELVELQAACNDLERPYSMVNGSIKNLSNYEQESNSVTLVQYKAGAMGLNLQKANKIIYFSLTEEAELFEQSKKRIHRIGQKQPCFYYMLICQNSIEDQEILPTLNIRKELTDELFQQDESPRQV
jgi:SNF2 family DNA or RNA helicase